MTPDDYYRRVDRLLSPAFHAKTVAIIGLGGGSYQAEKLVRLGPAEVRLVDFDVVELGNLCRTAYGLCDLGNSKVDALARRLSDANPFVAIKTFPLDICLCDEQDRASIFSGVDLIIAGTDHFPAQALVNSWSQRTETPAVFIGVHAGAEGGRVVWSVPGETPCYRCVAADRYARFAVEGTAGMDLPGAQGLLVDVQFIDMVALKVALAVLERGQASAVGRFYEHMRGRCEVIVRTSPEYAFGNLLWDTILGDLPTTPKLYGREIAEEALLAMDTIWLKTACEPDCPDCRYRQASAAMRDEICLAPAHLD